MVAGEALEADVRMRGVDTVQRLQPARIEKSCQLKGDQTENEPEVAPPEVDNQLSNVAAAHAAKRQKQESQGIERPCCPHCAAPPAQVKSKGKDWQCLAPGCNRYWKKEASSPAIAAHVVKAAEAKRQSTDSKGEERPSCPYCHAQPGQVISRGAQWRCQASSCKKSWSKLTRTMPTEEEGGGAAKSDERTSQHSLAHVAKAAESKRQRTESQGTSRPGCPHCEAPPKQVVSRGADWRCQAPGCQKSWRK
jgi:hypothetical protein